MSYIILMHNFSLRSLKILGKLNFSNLVSVAKQHMLRYNVTDWKQPKTHCFIKELPNSLNKSAIPVGQVTFV